MVRYSGVWRGSNCRVWALATKRKWEYNIFALWAFQSFQPLPTIQKSHSSEELYRALPIWGNILIWIYHKPPHMLFFFSKAHGLNNKYKAIDIRLNEKWEQSEMKGAGRYKENIWQIKTGEQGRDTLAKYATGVTFALIPEHYEESQQGLLQINWTY